jgi:thiamine-phosphate pyrophosphorylase
MTLPVARIIDENLNRLAEGLRVLEDIARMVLNDTALTSRLKNLRHDLIRGDLPFNLQLLRSRDSSADVGAALDVPGESREKDLPLIAIANSRRVQEALRVLEDLTKIPEYPILLSSDQFRKARFEIYTLEQKLVSRLTRLDKIAKISGLYVIIDTQTLNGRSHLEAARQVIEAGVKVVQLRDKTTMKRDLIPIARSLQELCRQNDVLFIMNDYLDIALAIDTDGLHIGQEDLPLDTARQLLPPDRVLGISVTTIEQATQAEASGADYIAVGSIYPTSSKDNIGVVGIERLQTIKQIARTPVVAIGGINQNNAREVRAAGADSLCVINAVLNAPNIKKAARDMIELIGKKEQ